MSNKLNIFDWLVHGGHQYEFFKLNHNFYCTGKNGKAPNYKDLGRPENKNVKFVNEPYFLKNNCNIIMIRAGTPHQKLDIIRKKTNGVGIAVMQTHTPFIPPPWTRCIVWNSKVSMNRFKKQFSKPKSKKSIFTYA